MSAPNLTVTYLGPPTSYTHAATLQSFPPKPETNPTLTPSPTITDVFASVATGTADRGVVPFENSSNGSVVFTLDLFANLSGEYADIVVVGEAYVRVNHCLVGHAASGNADIGWEKIEKLYSHPQAWGQCKGFLGKHFKGTEKQDVSSTSRGAEIVASEPDGKTAAISSALAAEANGLQILAANIQDSSTNTTRFLILQRKSTAESYVPAEEADKPAKTLVSFTVGSHSSPGALADCLAVFKKHGLSLTSINSRPSGEGAWCYVFFVEFKGRKGFGSVDAALGELEGVASGWRWLGSWVDMLG